MKRLLFCILVFCSALLNINAVRSPFERRTRVQISPAEQLQNVVNTLRKNKIKFIEQQQVLEKDMKANAEAIEANRKVISVYDRLIFALSSRYQGGEVDEFLSEYCITLAENEQKEKRPLVNFYVHLSDVIRNAKSEREDLAITIENYLHSASVTEPITAARFILNNSYSNGQNGQRANGLNKVDLGPRQSEPGAQRSEQPIAEAARVSDFEFSGEVEDWFARNLKIEAEPQVATTQEVVPDLTAPADTAVKTNEQQSQQIPPLESSTQQPDMSAPDGTPASSNVIQPQPNEYSQTTTASTSEPKEETEQTKSENIESHP